MKKQFSPLYLSMQWIGLVCVLCLWTSCSSPKLTQRAVSSDNPAFVTQADETPQAAQTKAEGTIAADVELVASNDPAMLPPVAKDLDAALTSVSAENPKLARKVSKLVHKVEKQAALGAATSAQEASVKDKNAAQKLLAKAEKKFDIMKAKKAEAAQANATLVGLGALLAVVGLVLLLATSGTGATIGLISLIVGVVLLILSLIAG